MKIKAQMLYELASFKKAFSCFFPQENDDEMYHLYVIKPAGDEEQLDDWTGKMNETKRTIMSVGADIKMLVNTNTNTLRAEVNTLRAE